MVDGSKLEVYSHHTYSPFSGFVILCFMMTSLVSIRFFVILIILVSILSCINGKEMKKNEYNPTECQNVWEQILKRDFTSWNGIPSECDYTAFDNSFQRISDIVGTGTLGEFFIPSHYRVYIVNGYSGNLRVWCREKELVLIEANAPQLKQPVGVLLDVLGEPLKKLSYYWDVMEVPEGEWIYPQKGIVLFFDYSRENILRISLFHSCNLKYYIQNIRFIYEKVEEESIEWYLD
jgi:hypothetical protein